MAAHRNGGTGLGSRRARGRRLLLVLVLASIAGTAVAACGPLAARGVTPAPESAGDIGGPVVGAWMTEITPDDLRRAGVTDPGLVDENSGRFTWTFNADGTWDQLQESVTGASIANPLWRGTYTIEGSRITQVTTFPARHAGETATFSFAVEGDELRLRSENPPDPILPIITDTYRWKRTSP